MTPKILKVYIDAYQKRKEIEAEEFKVKFEAEHKSRLLQAYYISRWVWTKKVDIKKILNSKEKKVMTDDELLEKVKVLNAMFGGEVKTVV